MEFYDNNKRMVDSSITQIYWWMRAYMYTFTLIFATLLKDLQKKKKIFSQYLTIQIFLFLSVWFLLPPIISFIEASSSGKSISNNKKLFAEK